MQISLWQRYIVFLLLCVFSLYSDINFSCIVLINDYKQRYFSLFLSVVMTCLWFLAAPIIFLLSWYASHELRYIKCNPLDISTEINKEMYWIFWLGITGLFLNNQSIIALLFSGSALQESGLYKWRTLSLLLYKLVEFKEIINPND